MSRAYDNAADARLQQGGRRNLIINGNFDVWQRGTTFNTATVSDHYSADRWKYYNYDGDSTVTQQSFTVGQTDVPGEPQYYLRHTCGSTEFYVEQRIEDVRTAAGQTVTMSAWIKSSVAQTLKFRLYQNFGSGGSSQVTVTNTDVAVTTGWARYTLSIDVPSISGKTIGSSSFVKIHIGGSSVTDGSTIDIAQVQLEYGNVATPFEHRSYGEELALCQRYYQRINATANNDLYFSSLNNNSGAAIGGFSFPTSMRADVTAIETTGTAGDYEIRVAGSTIACSQVPTFVRGTDFNIFLEFTASGLTAGQASQCRADNSSSFLAWSAEL